jgi:hypothetical protein
MSETIDWIKTKENVKMNWTEWDHKHNELYAVLSQREELVDDIK